MKWQPGAGFRRAGFRMVLFASAPEPARQPDWAINLFPVPKVPGNEGDKVTALGLPEAGRRAKWTAHTNIPLVTAIKATATSGPARPRSPAAIASAVPAAPASR
jgi:hypothetical protein